MVLGYQMIFLKFNLGKRVEEYIFYKDKDGMEYLWQGKSQNIGERQAPVLFPNCGSVTDDAPLFIMGDEGVIERPFLVMVWLEKKRFWA